MKKVVVVSTDDVCKMRKKNKYSILDSENIEKYIRKYINNITSEENNIINYLNKELEKKRFFVELIYDNSTLNLYEIFFDNDLRGFDFINNKRNNIIFYNYEESNLKLTFNLVVQEEYKNHHFEFYKNICLHQLNDKCKCACKLADKCTKYKIND